MASKLLFRLTAIGLTETEARIIKSICAISAGRARSYQLVDLGDGGPIADIFLINAESPAAMTSWRQINKTKDLPAVFLSRSGQAFGKYNLKLPVITTTLLKLLDALTIAEHEFIPDISRQDRNQLPYDHLAQPAGQSIATVTIGSTSSARFRALVVDDSPTVRKQIELGLNRSGGEAFCVETGEQALTVITQQRFDLIFLDVVLPGADGYAVCRAIKKSRENKDIPVIMLTSKSSPFDKVRGALAGCDTYLTKPVTEDLFRSTIKKYLSDPPEMTELARA